MENFIYSPPVVAVLFFAIFYGLSAFLSRYSHHGVMSRHETDAYACGQRGVNNYISPDYREFYPFAALFTVVHVLILVVATAPAEEVLLPVVFILMALGALSVVFKKGK